MVRSRGEVFFVAPSTTSSQQIGMYRLRYISTRSQHSSSRCTTNLNPCPKNRGQHPNPCGRRLLRSCRESQLLRSSSTHAGMEISRSPSPGAQGGEQVPGATATSSLVLFELRDSFLHKRCRPCIYIVSATGF